MRSKRRCQNKRTTKTKYRTKRCRRNTRRTNLDWNKILEGAKTVGSGLLKAGKAAGGFAKTAGTVIGNVAGAVLPQLQYLPQLMNVAGKVKDAYNMAFGKDEEEQSEAQTDIKRMKLTIIKLSKQMVSKYPQLREHPFYTEMSKLYDDIQMLENTMSGLEPAELQRQLYPLMARFKQALLDYKELMNQE